nr:hypothetical protein Itr_chr13CG12290 [Ipomoea trifida]
MQLPALTPEEDAKTAALTTSVLPPPLASIDEESYDEDDALPLTRSLLRKQKSKEPESLEPEPSGLNTRGPLPLVIRPQVPQIQDQSDSSSTWIEESSKGEDDVDCVPKSIKQRIHDTMPVVVVEN